MPTTPTVDRMPFYAMAGAADAAVTTLRELPARIGGAVSDEKVRSRVTELPAEVKALRDSLPDLVLQAPATAADLPLRVRELATQTAREATKTYQGLATRGEEVVGRLRGEYGPAFENVVTAVRGKVAAVADDVADVAERTADDISTKR